MLRRHREMEPEVILQYIVHRLHARSSKEVLLLQEIISSMTSIETPVELNDNQIKAYGGGPVLYTELISQATRGSRSAGLRRDNMDGQRRLIKSLMSGKQLALPLLITLAQYRADCSFKAQGHPRYLGTVFDDVSTPASSSTHLIDYLCRVTLSCPSISNSSRKLCPLRSMRDSCHHWPIFVSNTDSNPPLRSSSFDRYIMKLLL